MLRVLAIANQKGGVGKTTTAVNLASGLALAGREVLLIDLDPQANATSGLGVEVHERRLERVLEANHEPEEYMPVPTGRPGLSLLPSAPALLRVAERLQGGETPLHRLRTYLSKYRAAQFVIMDCPPSLGVLTRNALVAAEGVIIPIQCEYYAMEGLTRVLTELAEINRDHNPQLELGGILLTMYDGSLELSVEVAEEVRANFPGEVYSVVIPRDVGLSEASSFGQTIYEYDQRSPASFAYAGLTREVLGNEQA